MYIAFIGEEEVTEGKVVDLIKETGAGTLVLVPSGQVEEVSYSKAKELGLKFDYTAYSTGSYIGRVKNFDASYFKRERYSFYRGKKKQFNI